MFYKLEEQKSLLAIVFGLLLMAFIVGCRHNAGIQQTPQTSPTIKVEPSSALFDKMVSIRLAGFAPGQSVTMRARMRLRARSYFESWATFTADENGHIDLGARQPLTGTYETVDPMGLFWSMVEYRDVDTEFSRSARDPIVVSIIAEVDGDVVASTQIERLLIVPDVIRVPVDENGLVGIFYLPGEDGPYPTVVVLGGSGGGLPWGRPAMLASHGYAALALAYFGMGPLPGELVEIPLEYFETAITWLQSQDRVDADRLGVMGESRGAELALLLGATFPGIRTVVGYMPSGLVWEGQSRWREERSAWSYHGTPLPFVPLVFTQECQAYVNEQSAHGKPVPYTPCYLASMENTTAVENATIPVENINGAVLLISGQDDQMWPSTPLSEIAIERLEEHNHPYPYLHLSYTGAGHNIGFPYYPATFTQLHHPLTGEFLASGGNAQDNAFANVDSWARVLEFLDENLANCD